MIDAAADDHALQQALDALDITTAHDLGIHFRQMRDKSFNGLMVNRLDDRSWQLQRTAAI